MCAAGSHQDSGAAWRACAAQGTPSVELGRLASHPALLRAFMCRLSCELMSLPPSMKRRSKTLAKVQGTSKLCFLRVYLWRHALSSVLAGFSQQIHNPFKDKLLSNNEGWSLSCSALQYCTQACNRAESGCCASGIVLAGLVKEFLCWSHLAQTGKVFLHSIHASIAHTSSSSRWPLHCKATELSRLAQAASGTCCPRWSMQVLL